VPTQTAGVTNGGYWGVNIAPHGIYRVSMYLKAAHGSVRSLLGHPHPALDHPACLHCMLTLLDARFPTITCMATKMSPRHDVCWLMLLTHGSTPLHLLPATWSSEDCALAWQDDSLTVKVSLESNDGTTSYASTSFEDVDGEWRHYKATLTVPEEVLFTLQRGRIECADPMTPCSITRR